jgi:AcrR family transcriptional regulator
MKAGRPREFDADQALDRALQIFWQKGYEGASLPELTAAMGINRPSLYAAFGNKEALFRRAMERYVSGPAAYFGAALEQPTSRAVVECVLQGAIDLVTGAGNPRGCFLVQGALACGAMAQPARDALAKRRNSGIVRLKRRFKRAVAEGDLPPACPPDDLARYVVAVVHGMSVQAAGGATRQQLQRVAKLALRSWPQA